MLLIHRLGLIIFLFAAGWATGAGTQDLKKVVSVSPNHLGTGNSVISDYSTSVSISILEGLKELSKDSGGYHPIGTSSRTRRDIKAIQIGLKLRGLYDGSIDGIAGSMTRWGIVRFQEQSEFPVTGVLTAGQYKLIASQSERIFLERIAPKLVAEMPANAASPAQLSRVLHFPAKISASRIFAGPTEYPPWEFAAYGIIVFRTRASDLDRPRHEMFCKAFVNSIRSSSDLDRPISEQMVTVWPVVSSDASKKLTSMQTDRVCPEAVSNYSNIVADRAFRQASQSEADMEGIGPFLIAWSPGKSVGSPNARVLVVNLSEESTYEGALEVMVDWVVDIERDPALWRSGWWIERMFKRIQEWADKYGTQMLTVSSAK